MVSLLFNRKFFRLLGAITLAAFGLRVFRLDTQSPWWDEVMPVTIVRLPFFTEWWVPVFQDRGYPPGLYFLLELFGLFLIAQMLFRLVARGRSPRALRWRMIATFGAGLLLVPWFLALQLSPIQGHPNLGWIPI